MNCLTIPGTVCGRPEPGLHGGPHPAVSTASKTPASRCTHVRGRLAAGLILLAVLGGHPATLPAQPADAAQTAGDAAPASPAASPAATEAVTDAATDTDDHSDEIAVGLLAVIGVALLGLVMLSVAILGGYRVRRLARHTGRRNESPDDGDDSTESPPDRNAVPDALPPRPEQNGTPSASEDS